MGHPEYEMGHKAMNWLVKVKLLVVYGNNRNSADGSDTI
jgi:hypothetical protein